MRKDTVIDDGWKFIRQDIPNAQSRKFDDAGWKTVDLPHTWNALDGQDGGSNYYRGAGWYRLHLHLDSSELAKVIFLRFEAASMAARVFVNGQLAGEHRGAFGAFCFDVTNLLAAGDNLIAVRVDNSPNPDIPPLSGDFTVCGGLYRSVHLLQLDPVHVSPLDDASSGVYLTPVHVDESSAQVRFTVKLHNDLDADRIAAVECAITDAEGVCVASGRVEQPIAAHAAADGQTSLVLEHPHLWNGRDDPYLYTASVRIRRDGKIVDRVEQPLGLRSFHVDPQRGFFLNGQSYPLHGVGVHQDFFNKGWAESNSDIDRSYELINELGCTAVRLAHYQHPDYEYSLCDRSGIVVWAELPLVNRITDSPAFSDNAKQQVRELIKQNYNHPSICFWSLFNEQGPRTRTDWTLIEQLNGLAHQLDPDRPTVAASHLPARIGLNWIPDLIGFNRYFGWYTGTIADWPTELDKLHDGHPDRAIGISEYGAGGSIAQHEEHPTTQPATKGHWHPEEWESIVHEAAYGAMKDRPWLWGTFVWSMFDFACDDRNEGDRPGQNDKGLVTADRAVKKDAFYFYKANWSRQPFVYITSRRFTPHPSGTAELKVYSNCDSVELFLKGKSLGTRAASDHVFRWEGVELPMGKCELRAVGTAPGIRLRICVNGIAWEQKVTLFVKSATLSRGRMRAGGSTLWPAVRSG